MAAHDQHVHAPRARPARRIVMSVLALLLAARGALAQGTHGPTSDAPQAGGSGSGTVEGIVTTDRGAPIADATVAIEGTRRGALTDEGGRFRIPMVPAGTTEVVVRRVGYAPERRAAVVTTAGTTTVTIALREAAVVIAPVVVSATREAQRRSEASATIEALGGAELRRTGAAHPGEIMNRLPGVHVTELSGEGHMTAIRQPITTKPVYLYLEDGVPTRATGFFNHNALYEVNLPQAGGIEVLKGPGTALYGSDAIGGVINVLTRPAPLAPTAEGSLEGGSHGWSRLLLSGGDTRGEDGVRADLNLTRTQGWRDASSYHREIGTVRWDHVSAAGWTAKTVLSGSNIHQQDVYTLTQAQYDARSPINRSPISYRQVDALRLSSALERERGASLWSLTPYARYDVLELIPYWQLSYDPQLWDTRNYSLGAMAKYRREFVPLHARLIAGADLDWSPGSFTAQRVNATRTADGVYAAYTLGAMQYDYAVAYRSLSPYAQLELTPFPKLKLDAGVRYDLAGYAYDTHLPPDQSDTTRHRRPANTTVSYAHLSPKIGLTYDLSPSANLFVSYRHGFRAPSQGQLFQQNTAANTIGLRPVKVDSWETGVRGGFGGRVLYELSLYDMTLTDDILTFVTARNTREAVNAGRSRYRGVETALGVALAPRLRLDASWSVSDQRYVTYVPQAAQPATSTAPAKPAVSYSGNRVEQAPRDLADVMLAWSPALLRGGRVAVEYSHTGRYAMDPANTHQYPGHDLLNLQGSAVVHGRAELFARVTNLLDRRYAELVAYDAFQGAQYTPGAPRSVYLGARFTWER